MGKMSKDEELSVFTAVKLHPQVIILRFTKMIPEGHELTRKQNKKNKRMKVRLNQWVYFWIFPKTFSKLGRLINIQI